MPPHYIWSKLSVFSQRKHSAVSGVKQEAQKVLGEGEDLLDEANQRSDDINREIQVQKYPAEYPAWNRVTLCYYCMLPFYSADIIILAQNAALAFPGLTPPHWSKWTDSFSLHPQDLEEMEGELGPLHDQLSDRVGHLTSGLSNGRLASHVLTAEDHAKQLNESAAILDG